ncbi:hypoxanthine-guanine phosphoribosyltransferase [Gilvimarinus sp. DA14]|uniref:hypoxanthine-guanine phosphoribosyltransferase n=1 Tax=Gilvimarinus sp. DA14 TaxID=2956798 RepID=UPI0020B8EEC0|nr:hypoxanthine-guanine phosphoribosyltransferase [Gilvimarinus sp. DA14]UTF60939.1 hypoxanthine-guanine phosphoribosyltransferase [Gilvimarinus sp. DA14]
MSQPECLYNLAEIDAALDSMAAQINADYADQLQPLLVLVLLKGALVTAGALLPKLTVPVEVDYLHASRYRDNSAADQLRWLAKPQTDLSGRDLLIVDDILDQGITLREVVKYCLECQASSVATAVLAHKQLPQPALVAADYLGLQVPDRYVYGFGMDNAERDRNAPGIFAL